MRKSAANLQGGRGKNPGAFLFCHLLTEFIRYGERGNMQPKLATDTFKPIAIAGDFGFRQAFK